MSMYLAKPQRFVVRPAPGWVDLSLEEVVAILGSPTQKYKFQPSAAIEDGVVIISDCDYRQALEIVMRATFAHDVEWVIHSGRVESRADWSRFFEKSGIKDLWARPAANETHVSAQVSHPVVGTAREIRQSALSVLGLAASESADSSGVDGDEETLVASRRLRVDSGKNRTRVLVSLGGEPLYKRGYKARGSSATAPLPEHHASACFSWALKHARAGMAASLAEGHAGLLVPFAGTGTTGFESLCRILNIAPALTRSSYACEAFTFHPEATMASIRKRLELARLPGPVSVVFGDNHPDVLTGLEGQVSSFQKAAASKAAPDQAPLDARVINNDFLTNPGELLDSRYTSWFLPLNPPYGLRLAKATTGGVIYERLGKALARISGRGDLSGYVICPDEESWRNLSRGLKGFRCQTRHFSHGGRDTRLVAFCNAISS